MPDFSPLRVRGGRHRLRRAVRRRRRAMAAGLAMAAAALAASGARDAGRTGGGAQTGAQAEERAGAGAAGAAGARQRERRPVEMVSAPVRIADAATVRLLRRGDRVDVIAAAAGPQGVGGEPPDARVVAAGARVAEVPKVRETSAGGGEGALVVLSVPRATAAALAGVGATSRLAVTVC